MSDLWTVCVAACGLGLLSTAQPCMLAGYAAATAAVASGMTDNTTTEKTGRTLRQGISAMLALIVGVLAVYAVWGAAFEWGLTATGTNIGVWSHWGARVMGPMLVLSGMWLAGLLNNRWWPRQRRLTTADMLNSPKDAADVRRGWRALPVGMLLAAWFCPASAALFFGVALPMGATAGLAAPAAMSFGLGCALPLALTAAAMVSGGRWLKRLTDGRVQPQRWLGWTVLLFGVWHTLRHVYGVG